MKKNMKAAQMVAIGQPLEIREVPKPDLGDDDVLVQIARCGLNGGGHAQAGTDPSAAGSRQADL